MRKIIFATLVAAALAAPAFAAAPKYSVALIGNANSDVGSALNDLGHVVTYGYTPQLELVSTLNMGNQTVALGSLGGSTRANDLNNIDQVVGNSAISKGGAQHAFLYTSGAMQDLGTLGGASSNAVAINNAGTVVGTSDLASGGDQHAFIYTASHGMTDIGTLGGNYSEALDVNAHGDVLGRSKTVDGAMHTFLYSKGVMTDLTASAGLPSDATYLRFGGNGEIIGQALDPMLAQTTSYTYINNHYTNRGTDALMDLSGDKSLLNAYAGGGWLQVGPDRILYSDLLAASPGEPGWAEVNSAISLNARGQILAYGVDIDGKNFTLLMTPVPEPATWAMLFAGLGLIAWQRRRSARA